MITRKFHNAVVLIIFCIFIVMGLGGYASAQEPPVVEPPYSTPIAVGNEFCPPVGDPECVGATGSTYPTTCNLVSPRELFSEPSSVPSSCKFAWTSLLFRPGSTSELEALMCAGIPYQELCGTSGIWGVPGTSTSTSQDLESLMCDPSFDAANKELDLSTGNITGWEVIIPIVDRTDPMAAPDPNPVWGYAKINIVEICVPGSPGCRGAGSCMSHGFCIGGDKKIVIDRISCLPCGNVPNLDILTPYPINFGEVNVGDLSVVQEVRISNTGDNSILHISGVDIPGSDATDFTIQSDDCSVRVLLPSSECTIELVFSPISGGEKSAMLSITSNDPDKPIIEVPLIGYGIAYNLSITNIAGSGGVSAIDINCPADCAGSFAPGATVDVTATPDSGWYFDSWGGDIFGNTNPYSLLINSDKNITATFKEIDNDGDGVPDARDNCPFDQNTDQSDMDNDGKGDVCDICPNDRDNDIDNDGVCGNIDNCPLISNPTQIDTDSDGKGDACDTCPLDANNDADGDGVCGNVDNCPQISNPSQSDSDGDGKGDICDICPYDKDNDIDRDGICGNTDNCPYTPNPDQADMDGDGVGNACDGDMDGDGFTKATDCNDNNSSIHPGAPEIKHDGIDQDCNGYDLTIDIIKAVFASKKNTLTVEAKSDLSQNANLVLVNYGPMKWNRKKLIWELAVRPAGGNPGIVTVSGLEGSESSPITVTR